MKPKQPDLPNHIDLASLNSQVAWRIYWMRFIDRWIGPLVARVLTIAMMQVAISSCSSIGFPDDTDDSPNYSHVISERDKLRP